MIRVFPTVLFKFILDTFKFIVYRYTHTKLIGRVVITVSVVV